LFAKIQIEKVFFVQGPKTKDAPGASPRHYGAPVMMALYNGDQVYR